MDAETLIRNRNDVLQRIAMAATEARRAQGDVTLNVVSKTFHADSILPLLDAGHRVFGENRVQESQQKWPDLKAAYPDMELRLIGPLQSNKAKDAVALFDVIETVDRPKIAAALAKEMATQGRQLPVFVQVNTGEEDQKAGITPTETAAFVETCQNQHGLNVVGLMAIPPADQTPAPHFALLAKLAARCGLSLLSMGMSGDFEAAVSLGATHVRVGSGIFGPRR